MRALPILLTLSLVAVASCGPDASPASPPVDPAELAAAEAKANPDGSCKIRRIRNPRTGKLKTTNCVYEGLGYPAYADAYRFKPVKEFPNYDPAANGLSMFTFSVDADFAGYFGLKDYDGDDPIEGVLDVARFFNANQAIEVSIVGTRNKYGAFVLGAPGALGNYEISITEEDPGDHSCDSSIALQGDVAFESRIRRNNSCRDVIGGTEYRSHYRYVFAEPGKSYTLAIDGATRRFQPILLAIAIDGTVLAQSVGDLPDGVTSREITFTLPLSYATAEERFVRLFVGATRNGTYQVDFRSN